MFDGAVGARHAAAEQARLRQEEEEMTTYSREDLADGWEFKILRSSTAAFRRADKLQRVLEEEARAGWTLVEKFDNSRVRLKRPVHARSGDKDLGFDPYRTQIGMSDTMLGVVVLAVIMSVILIFVLLRGLSM